MGLQASDDGLKDKPQANNVFAVIEELAMSIQVKRSYLKTVHNAVSLDRWGLETLRGSRRYARHRA